MRNKKFFAKALAFAMVMGTVGIHGAAISPVIMLEAANPVAIPTIAVDYTTYEAVLSLGTAGTNIDADTSNYICLQVLKDATGSKVSAEYWYKVTGGKATIDLSFLKATKKQYIRAYTAKAGAGAIFTIQAL